MFKLISYGALGYACLCGGPALIAVGVVWVIYEKVTEKCKIEDDDDMETAARKIKEGFS
jgi:hypothetical protein